MIPPDSTARTARPRRLAPFLLLALSLFSPWTPQAPAAGGNFASVELISETPTAHPGTPLTVAIRISPEPGWHTYWINPGHIGLPARVTWKPVEGARPGELQWPHPERIGAAPYIAYGYEADLTLLSQVEISGSVRPGQKLPLAANVSFLVCREDACVPGKADVALEVAVAGAPAAADPRYAALFTATRRMVPRTTKDWTARVVDRSDSLAFVVEGPAGAYPSTQEIEVFPLDFNVIDESVAPVAKATASGLEIEMRKRAGASALPESVRAVLVAKNGWDADDRIPAIDVTAKVMAAGASSAASAATPAAAATPASAATPAAAASAAAAPAQDIAAPSLAAAKPATPAAPAAASTPTLRTSATPDAAGAEQLTLLFAVALAFAGGLILNLMPCVFPVLSLKILGFVHIAHAEAATVRRHGLVFAAGVIGSFWVLAGTLLLIRAGGEALGWGFQLQEPGFVAVLALLLFGMALNLLGVFEIGTLLPRAAGQFDSRDGYRGSFFSGALATVLATPCTAPFMGAALGFAMAQPPMSAMIVFTALGAGMAAPYVVLSFSPPLLRRLPRPGAWMETFRQAMAFPLFATVVWLVWVFGQQVGNDGVLRLLSGFLMIGIAVWMGGRFGPAPLAAIGRVIARGATATAIVAGVALVSSAASLPTVAECATGLAGSEHEVSWIPYDEARLAELRSAGKPVFVDFTAAWCLSCKVNERVALQSEQVQSRLRELDVVAMKGDWTRGDPVITRALESFGRSGVPLYVFYPAGGGGEPVVLPSLLTPEIVLDALG